MISKAFKCLKARHLSVLYDLDLKCKLLEPDVLNDFLHLLFGDFIFIVLSIKIDLFQIL